MSFSFNLTKKVCTSSLLIRSFVRRQGRLTKGQKHAINTFWSKIGIEYQEKFLDFSILFKRLAPVTLEVGFGMGESLVSTAKAHPDQNFLAVEVYLPGIGSCLSDAQKAGITNLRIIFHDAVEVLENNISDRSLSSIQLFFPDPWKKIRHNKRRIIQPVFIDLVGRKLLNGGVLHIVTDCQSYAKYILTKMSHTEVFYNLSADGGYVPRLQDRPLTKFEKRAQRLNHNIWNLMFKKHNL